MLILDSANSRYCVLVTARGVVRGGEREGLDHGITTAVTGDGVLESVMGNARARIPYVYHTLSHPIRGKFQKGKGRRDRYGNLTPLLNSRP